MSHIQEGTLLWEPSEKWKNQSNLYDYMAWLKREKGLEFQNYATLWQWSVDELEQFWRSIWKYFDIQSKRPYETIITSHHMHGVKRSEKNTYELQYHCHHDCIL